MARSLLSMLPRLATAVGAVLLLALTANPATGQDAPPVPSALPVFSPATLAALGAAAEAACRARLEPRCLAEIALARIAAGQRGDRAVPPAAGAALVVGALAAGGHTGPLRAVLLTADAVRRIPPAGRTVPQPWDQTALLQAGLVAEVRLAAERIADPAARAEALVRLARRTLDPFTSAASVAAAEAHPPGRQGRVALGWARALALGLAGDREGLAAWLDALAQGPDFREEANGSPGLVGTAFHDGGNDTIIGPDGTHDGSRNLPRLAAHAWAALGDGPRALAAADEVRWLPARAWAIEGIVSYRPAFRSAADARLVALTATEGGDAGSLQPLQLRALIRLSGLREAERILVGTRAWDEGWRDRADRAKVPRLLAAAYARGGDVASAERVAAWVEERARRPDDGADAAGPRTDLARQEAERLAARVRLAAALARPAGHGTARALLDEHAAPGVVEDCIARGEAGCHALVLLLQAVTELPADPR